MARNADDYGRFTLRLAVGGLMLFHGVGKMFNGVGGVADLLASKGLPGFLAYGVFLGEVVAPLLVLAGYQARIGGGLIAITMVVAILVAHPGDIFRLGAQGEWPIELPMFYLLGGIAIIFLGAGKIVIPTKRGKSD